MRVRHVSVYRPPECRPVRGTRVRSSRLTGRRARPGTSPRDGRLAITRVTRRWRASPEPERLHVRSPTHDAAPTRFGVHRLASHRLSHVQPTPVHGPADRHAAPPPPIVSSPSTAPPSWWSTARPRPGRRGGGRRGVLRLRHRVPHRTHLRARPRAHPDRLGGQGGPGRSARRGPEPLAAVFSGPGTAVAHAAFQDLDVLQAACGAVPATVFDTQIVAGFLGMSTPSLSRLVDQVLGVTLPKADRLSDWLVRPISERQITYAVSDVAHLLELRDRPHGAPRGTRPPRVGPQRVHAGAGRPRATTCARGSVVEDSATSAACRGRSAASPRRWRRGGNAPRPRRTGPVAWCSLTSGCWRSRNGHHATSPNCAARGASTAATSRKGGRQRSSPRSSVGLALPSDAIRMPADSRDAPRPPAAVAVCSGLVRQIADDLDFDQGLLATRADIAQLLCGEPSRLDDRAGAETIAGDPLRRLIAGDVAAAFDGRGHARARGALAPAAGRPTHVRPSTLS